jgi:hypothetical protein
MSTPREQIQIDLVNYLNSRSDTFHAPYGVIAGMDDLPKGGKVRTVTFGQARWLDATAFIFSPKDIRIKCQGPAYHKFSKQKYNSIDELMEDLKKF